ncbi:MAG: hypothetical protein DID90_2727554344 [Candidatus Nitrotoga sp. LAW]|nr:MAG: hypothetical protein DID90_2727554344 [Candidatus Nitrotoga sp. LAW]
MPQPPKWQLQGMVVIAAARTRRFEDDAKIEVVVKTVLNLGQVTVYVFLENHFLNRCSQLF